MVTIGDFLPVPQTLGPEHLQPIAVPHPLKGNLISQGFKFAVLSLWISKLDRQLTMALPFKAPDARFSLFYSRASFPGGHVGIHDADMVTRNGHVALVPSIRKRHVEGDLLELGVAYREDSHQQEVNAIIDETICSVRFSGGMSAALEEVCRITDHLDSDQYSFQYGPHLIRHYFLRGPDLDCSWDSLSSTFSLRDFSMKPEARTLLDLSFSQTNPAVQFLLLWLALEAQVGNGPRIKQLADKRLKSRKLANEVGRLAKARGDFAHKAESKIGSNDILSLFLILRAFCIQDQAQMSIGVRVAETFLAKEGQ
jgi:hypothetical protein